MQKIHLRHFAASLCLLYLLCFSTTLSAQTSKGGSGIVALLSSTRTPTPTSTPTPTPTLEACEKFQAWGCCPSGTSYDHDCRSLGVTPSECCTTSTVGTDDTGSSGDATGEAGSAGSVGSAGTTGSGGSSGDGGTGGSGAIGGSGGYGGSSGSGGSSGTTGSAGSGGSSGSAGSAGAGGSSGSGGSGGNNGQVVACRDYESQFLRATLKIPNSDQRPTGNLKGHVYVDGCACILNGPICDPCTENSLSEACQRANEQIISSLNAIRKVSLTADNHAITLASIPVNSPSSTHTREFVVPWDTSLNANREYFVQGKIEFIAREPMPTKNTVSVVIQNSGRDIPPVAECKDNVEVSVVAEDGSTFTDGNWTLCYTPGSEILYSGNCKDGSCAAWKMPSQQDFDAAIGPDMNGLPPPSALCLQMGGALRTIRFPWRIEGEDKAVELDQCYFIVPNDLETPGSFFGVGGFYSYQIDRLSEQMGVPITSGEGFVPGEGSAPCEETDPSCDVPDVCKRNASSSNIKAIRCYFKQNNSNCIQEDERIGTCEKVDSFDSINPGQSQQIHRFSDRTFPSGSEAPTSCWADVVTICDGLSSGTLDSYYGDKEPTPICKEAMLNSARTICSQCKSECMDSCSDAETGPCTQSYYGYGEGCGACQYNCEKTYANCLGA